VGSRSREVTRFTCELASGTCRSTVRTESEACTRDATGVSCGATTCGAYGECEGGGCSASGTHSRECMDFACSGGRCVGTPRTERSACPRDPEGQPCEDGNPCTEGDTCAGRTCRAGPWNASCCHMSFCP
jgi:hypothetical protein